MAWAAATSLGDDIAQSVFVTRVGADALPRMFLFKGLLDVLAAALYLPLTRRRSTTRVWQVAITIYVVTVLSARVVVTGGGVLSAYALYVAHECAWTILTIHWGVFILDAFNASQARRLFPVLFTAARVGGILAGALLRGFAERVGATDMLFVAAAFAGLAGVLSLFGRRLGASESLVGMRASTIANSGDARPDEHGPTSIWQGWRQAMSSPLVRAIALSTAAMVLVRYGMQMVSIDQISASFEHQEDRVASFLGAFTTGANLCGALLGVFLVPRLLERLGVGAANIAYALSTVLALGAMLLAPGLTTAALARFVNTELKSALKTPLSTLFYGAEPAHARPLARAFVFGAVIPAATIATALIFELAKWENLALVAYIALAVAGLFTVACVLQNRRWRARLRELLRQKLSRAAAADPVMLSRARTALAEYRSSSGGEAEDGDLDDIARALASPDRRLRAVAEEVLAETIPRARAHALCKRFAHDE